MAYSIPAARGTSNVTLNDNRGPVSANILVIDGKGESLPGLQAALRELSRNLVRVHSAADALCQLRKEDFAAILLDLDIPGIDGFETARQIREQERSRNTPIIFLAAAADLYFPATRAYALGAVDYLLKPLTPEIIRAKVEGFVDLFEKTRQVQEQAEQLRQLERNQFEHELAEAKQRWELQRLRDEAQRKNEFLAMLAHELRNPLAPIRNAVQWLRLRCPTDKETRWAQDVIDRQVQHLTRLVDDLLDVSRINRGAIQLRKEAVDIDTIVARAVELAQPLIDARKHDLTVSLLSEPALLEADPARLSQALANVLNNAAKYTNEGGKIWLTFERDGNDLVVSVRDTGVGIPAELVPQVFDLFMQEDQSLERTQGGLGIGLTLVRTLVQLHGGTIQVFSAGPGQGSEFVMRLPVLMQTTPTKSGTKRETRSKPPAPPRRILIVDDNADSAGSLALLLRHAGHQVETAHDGLAALTAAKAQSPEVVLLDIALPRLNGLEVARRLRGELGLSQALLVATTGYGQMEDQLRSREAGFNAHLVKPVDLEALAELLAHPELATLAHIAK
jgi:signal transduction histidine kinase